MENNTCNELHSNEHDQHEQCEDESEVNIWRNIIAELCSKAPDNSIRDCLRLYDPSKPTKNIRTIFKSKCNIDILAKTLSFLGKEDYENQKKDVIVDALILRIKNFFPDICQLCGDTYCIKLEDTPFMACEACGQEVHKPCFIEKLNYLNMLNKDGMPDLVFRLIPGMHYLCGTCEKDTIIDQHNIVNTDESLLFTQSTRNHNGNDNINKTSMEINHYVEPNVIEQERNHNTEFMKRKKQLEKLMEIPMEIPSTSESPQGQQVHDWSQGDNSIINSIINRENMYEENMYNTTKYSNGIRDRSEEDDPDDPKHSHINRKYLKDQICRFYKKGSCKFGRKGTECPYSHPKPCRKLMQHGNKAPRGCKEGSNCSDYHPRMCSNSITTGECYKSNCPYVHVKGTKRKRGGETNIQHSIDHVNDKNTQNSIFKDHSKDFLDLLHNFKIEIMEAMDMKIAKMLSIQTPINSIQTTPHYPVRPTENVPIAQYPVRPTENVPIAQYPVRPTENVPIAQYPVRPIAPPQWVMPQYQLIPHTRYH